MKRREKIRQMQYQWGMDYKDLKNLKNKLFQTYRLITNLKKLKKCH